MPSQLYENEEFDIICKIIGTDKCPLYPPDAELTIGNNPGYKKFDTKVLNFVNFSQKTTVITITAGKLLRYKYDKESKRYDIIFSNSNIDYQYPLEKEITINVDVSINDKEEKITCVFNFDKNIICEIDNIESDNMNIKVIKNPLDDYESLEGKVIVYEEFKDKGIYTFVAGKIQQGKCESDSNNYIFSFKDSKSSVVTDEEFLLQMKVPNKEAVCKIKDNTNTEESLYDVECTIEGRTTCPVDVDSVIIVGDEEPKEIEINDTSILYFSSFSGQNSLIYKITVGNILKSDINKENCRYNFKFSDSTYALDYFSKNILFYYDMKFNDKDVVAKCILSEIEEIDIKNEVKNVSLSCYFDLDEETCKDDNLSYYDLYIGDDVESKIVVEDSLQNIIFDGFSNKQTVTVLAGQFTEKYNENNKFVFVLQNNVNSIILKDTDGFDLSFIISEDTPEDVFNSKCTLFNNDNTIRCELESESLNTNNDIIIIENPQYLILNENTIYFEKFVNLRTYTIKGGQIQKVKCKEGGQFKFNLINTISSNNIPEEKKISIAIKTNNKGNIKRALCTIKKANKYSMTCISEENYCPQDIILYGDSIKPNPNNTLFSPNSTFFNDFNNKRTVTIKAGKLNKGECHIIGGITDITEQYNFSFTDNIFTYNIDKDITFNLKIILKDETESTAKCVLNLSGKDNTILCNSNVCPNEGDDLEIKADPTPIYNVISPNSIFFEGFSGGNTTTIVMNQTGMIIKKKYNDEKQLEFIITDNYVNGNKPIVVPIKFNLKLYNDKTAICTIGGLSKVISPFILFNISCKVNDMTMEDEIEIYEDPYDDDNDYYFSGYKDKKTLSLKIGSIIRDINDNKKFIIQNNEFIGDISNIKISNTIKIEVKYDQIDYLTTSCIIDSSTIIDKKININCNIPDEITFDPKTISILNNPESFLLSDKITTLNFLNFKNISLYTLTLGKILKKGVSSTKYEFYFDNTTISNSIPKAKDFNLPIKINNGEKEEEKISTCKIQNNKLIYKMNCYINNYNPTDNIDLKVDTNNYNLIDIISPNTLYIDIPTDKTSTTTLKAGYIKKLLCQNGLYIFSINANKISGTKIENINGQFNLTLKQFKNESSCTINSTNYIISCKLNLDEANEEEMKYCKNMNEDIDIIDISDDYIIVDDGNVVHLYGLKGLGSYTVEAGELIRGECNNNVYTFTIENSKIYNDLLNDDDKVFSLQIIDPVQSKARCILPSGLYKHYIFNITCTISISGSTECPIKPPDKDIFVGDSNPLDIMSDKKRVNFKNFTNKATVNIVSAGTLKLANIDNTYYLNFSNSNIDNPLNILFNLTYKFNNAENKRTICETKDNSKDILCELKDIESDFINVEVVKDPVEQYFDNTSVAFLNFKGKQIISFYAGRIQKGKCDGKKYIFNFIDSISLYNLDNIEFSLQMKTPYRIAICTIKSNNEINSYSDNVGIFNNVECIIEGVYTCPVESEDDEIEVGLNEPSPYQINETSYLYYSRFSGQSTNEFIVEGGIITKKSVGKNNKNDDELIYTFSFLSSSINKLLEKEITFDMEVILEIYNGTGKISNIFTATCIIPSNFDEFNVFDIECSFSVLKPDYSEDNNYDIKSLNKTIIYQDEDDIDVYVNFNYMSTITMHDCQLFKGSCSNNNYNFYFSSCLLPDEKDISKNIEFNLKIENGEESNCIIDKNNLNEIQCMIQKSQLCKNVEEGKSIDITIGDEDPVIESLKYFYISGLKNLFTTTLTGGLLNYGECESDTYKFKFIDTTITKTLPDDTYFDLQIEEPLKINSSCKIPGNRNNFTLNCMIKDKDICPMEDKYSLKINEIINEKKEDIIKPNTIYLKEFENRKIILIKGGQITEGYCDDNNYIFYFVDSEISGDFTSEDLNKIENSHFMINFKNISVSASCNVSDNVAFDNENPQSIEVICSIQGNDQCPMYDIPYIEVEDNDPATDESTIKPKIIQFSNFKNKILYFTNYYISLLNLYEDKCHEAIYTFDLDINSITEDIPNYLPISLNLTSTEGKEIEANCSLENNNNKEVNLINVVNGSKIHCEINNDVLDDNYTLNLNYIYLEQEEKYLINLGEKTLDFGYKDCPSFSPYGNKTIEPTKTSEKSFYFIIIIICSYTDGKDIMIFDKYFKRKKYIIFILVGVKGDTNEELIANCTLPEKTSQNMEMSCYMDNVYDDKSDYFSFKSTEDIIIIDGKNISLINALSGVKIDNIFKDGGGEEEEEEEEEGKEKEEEEEEEEGTHHDVDPSGNDRPFFSTVGGIILIIVISLLGIAIIIIIIFLVMKKCKPNGGNNQNNGDGGNDGDGDNNGDGGNNQGGDNSGDEENNQGGDNNGNEDNNQGGDNNGDEDNNQGGDNSQNEL